MLLVACNNKEQGKPEAIISVDSATLSSKEDISKLLKTHNLVSYSIKNLKSKSTTDTLFVYVPKTNDETMECIDSSCTTYFKFADSQYPDFSQVQALGGELGNAGDLDDDGI